MLRTQSTIILVLDGLTGPVESFLSHCCCWVIKCSESPEELLEKYCIITEPVILLKSQFRSSPPSAPHRRHLWPLWDRVTAKWHVCGTSLSKRMVRIRINVDCTVAPHLLKSKQQHDNHLSPHMEHVGCTKCTKALLSAVQKNQWADKIRLLVVVVGVAPQASNHIGSTRPTYAS